MVSLAFEKILLQLLAAVVIQFTPVDTYFEGNKTWTWGDGKSIRYTLSPARAAEGTATFTYNLFEGEVRAADHVILTLHKQADDRFYWKKIVMDNTRENATPSTYSLPCPAVPVGTPPLQLYPVPWVTASVGMPLIEEKQLTLGGLACRMLVYKNNNATVCVLLHKGTLYGISLSTTGKLFPVAEHRLVRENPG